MGEYRVIMAVSTIFEIFEGRSPKPMADFLPDIFTLCRGSYPLPSGEVLNFFIEGISGSGGLNFQNSTPLKKFRGILGVGGGCHLLGTLSLNIPSREKVSAATPYPRGRPSKMGIFCTFLKVPPFYYPPPLSFADDRFRLPDDPANITRKNIRNSHGRKIQGAAESDPPVIQNAIFGNFAPRYRRNLIPHRPPVRTVDRAL